MTRAHAPPHDLAAVAALRARCAEERDRLRALEAERTQLETSLEQASAQTGTQEASAGPALWNRLLETVGLGDGETDPALEGEVDADPHDAIGSTLSRLQAIEREREQCRAYLQQHADIEKRFERAIEHRYRELLRCNPQSTEATAAVAACEALEQARVAFEYLDETLEYIARASEQLDALSALLDEAYSLGVADLLIDVEPLDFVLTADKHARLARARELGGRTFEAVTRVRARLPSEMVARPAPEIRAKPAPAGLLPNDMFLLDALFEAAEMAVAFRTHRWRAAVRAQQVELRSARAKMLALHRESQERYFSLRQRFRDQVMRAE